MAGLLFGLAWVRTPPVHSVYFLGGDERVQR